MNLTLIRRAIGRAALGILALGVCLGADTGASVRAAQEKQKAAEQQKVAAQKAAAAKKAIDTAKKAPADKHELHLTNTFEVTYANISGPGKAATTYQQGFTYWDVIGLSGKGNFGNLQYTHSFRVRFSDDRTRNNGSKFGLDQAAFGVKFGKATLVGGDFYESYSQYTNRTRLQGLNFSYLSGKDNALDVRAMWGYAYARWDEMWRADDLKVKERQVAGVNLRQNLFKKRAHIGLSYIRTDDSDRQLVNDQLYRNDIGSVNYSLELIPKKLTVSGESAVSSTDESPRANAARKKYEGMAHRVQGVLKPSDPHTFTVLYERVDPKFRTLTGAADTDREKTQICWAFKTSPVTQLGANFLWYRNQLENANGRTETYRPELTLNTSKLLKREKNRLRMSVAVENQEIETRNQSLANVYSSVGYSDELFKVLNSATDFGVTRADSFAKDKDKLDYTFKQSFGYTHSFSSNLTLKPTLNFGTSYTQDDITNDINKVYDYSLGLVFDLPKTRFTTNLKVGQNRFVSDRVDDSEQFYFNVTFNYRPENIFGWKTNATVYLKALLNDFNFQTGNRNYRESVFTMGVTIPLDASYGKR